MSVQNTPLPFISVAAGLCVSSAYPVIAQRLETDLYGISISLEPSVGNWSLPCRSHYWIERNRVIWAKSWSRKKIAAARLKDTDDMAQRFSQEGPETEKPRTGWVTSFRRLFGKEHRDEY